MASKKICLSFLVLLAFFSFCNAQRRIYFENIKSEELSFPIDAGVGCISLEQALFPEIWENSDYTYAGVDFIFSGYYTVINPDTEEVETNGEVKLIRTRTICEYETIKEILTFYIKGIEIVGKVEYRQFRSEIEDDLSDPEKVKGSWIEMIRMTAIASRSPKYKDIKCRQRVIDENGSAHEYYIEQKSGSNISLSYFRSLIQINNLNQDEKPVIRKVK